MLNKILEIPYFRNLVITLYSKVLQNIKIEKGSDLYEQTIGEMEVGESGWVTSWSIGLDEDNYMWANHDATVKEANGGTVDTFIVRELDGLKVYLNDENVYSRGTAVQFPYIPVIAAKVCRYPCWGSYGDSSSPDEYIIREF